MFGFSALLLATPLFGMTLAPPAADLEPSLLYQAVTLHDSTALAGEAPQAGFVPAFRPMALTQGASEEGEGSASLSVSAEDVAAGDAESGAAKGPKKDAGDESSDDDYAEQMKTRAELSRIHRPLGIATYISMGVTLVLGGIQYYNHYGMFAGRDDNPCVTGDAIFGQGQCSGTPWLHLGSSFLTTGLYGATFAVSVLMPDPDDASAGDSEHAKTLRMHKLLRWVHFGGMVAQMLLGPIIANADAMGIDRANDYGTLQAMSTVHMGIGLVTFGAMTWAMALML